MKNLFRISSTQFFATIVHRRSFLWAWKIISSTNAGPTESKLYGTMLRDRWRSLKSRFPRLSTPPRISSLSGLGSKATTWKVFTRRVAWQSFAHPKSTFPCSAFLGSNTLLLSPALKKVPVWCSTSIPWKVVFTCWSSTIYGTGRAKPKTSARRSTYRWRHQYLWRLSAWKIRTVLNYLATVSLSPNLTIFSLSKIAGLGTTELPER